MMVCYIYRTIMIAIFIINWSIILTIRCTLLVEETIPRGAFVDPDEMRDLRSANKQTLTSLLLVYELPSAHRNV